MKFVCLLVLLALSIAVPAEAQKRKVKRKPPVTVHIKASIENQEARRLVDEAKGLAAAGNHREAIAVYERALPLVQKDKDPDGEATIHNNIGVTYDQMGELRSAIAAFERAIPLSNGASDHETEASAQFNLGTAMYKVSERPETILPHYERALTLYRGLKNRKGEADTLFNMGVVFYWSGQIDKANEYYKLAQAAR